MQLKPLGTASYLDSSTFPEIIDEVAEYRLEQWRKDKKHTIFGLPGSIVHIDLASGPDCTIITTTDQEGRCIHEYQHNRAEA